MARGSACESRARDLAGYCWPVLTITAWGCRFASSAMTTGATCRCVGRCVPPPRGINPMFNNLPDITGLVTVVFWGFLLLLVSVPLAIWKIIDLIMWGAG